jgi:hypothetical protein
MSFKRFDPEDFIVSADSIVGPAWSTNSASLSNIFFSTAQRSGPSGDYYVSAYQSNPASSTTATPQFNVAYGDADGYGTVRYYSSVTGNSPSRTIYGQFRNLIYGDENAVFNFGGVTSPNFYVVSLARARYKQTIFPGSLNIRLENNAALALTDNSRDVTTVTYLDCGRAFELVSGSNGSGVTNAARGGVSGSFGYLLPDIGVILFNPGAIREYTGFVTPRTSNTDTDNAFDFANECLSDTGDCNFGILSQETVTSDFAFIRARNAEFNYSENPSFISGSTGAIIFDNFIQNPQTYITSVGMYNDNNELLAVAKLSKPLKKDFTKEALIRVKLDF